MSRISHEYNSAGGAKHPVVRVPAGAEESRCWRCGQPIYWLRAGPGTIRIMVDVTQPGGEPPTAHLVGTGIAHVLVCPAFTR